MPSHSKKQARMMAGVAHNPEFAKKVGIPQKVGKEFNKADKKTGILKDSEHFGNPNLKNKFIFRGYIETSDGKQFEHKIVIEAPDDKTAIEKLKQEHSSIPEDTHFDITLIEKTILVNASQFFKNNAVQLPSMISVKEEKVEEAPSVGMDQGHVHLDKAAMDLVDGALRATAEAKTADERRRVLQKYADDHHVSYAVLYTQIMNDTGNTYFDQDDYMKGKQFSESKKLIESYKSALKKI